jgi:hypothetical protein
LPEEVAEAIGIPISNFFSFGEMCAYLMSGAGRPTTLFKMMERKAAELAFERAAKKEIFLHTSLFSYYFNDSWLEFSLEFDEDQLLRRLYLHHKSLPEPYEMLLKHGKKSPATPASLSPRLPFLRQKR